AAGGVLVTWQWRSAVAALARAEREHKARALAQVNALREAAPGAVPALLRDLEAARDDVLPRLRELWRQKGEPGKRMRVGLALLPAEPAAVRDELARWMLKAEHPAEVLLARDALMPHRDALKGRLW